MDRPKKDNIVVSGELEYKQVTAEKRGEWALKFNKRTEPKKNPGYFREYWYWRSDTTGDYHPDWPKRVIDVPKEVRK